MYINIINLIKILLYIYNTASPLTSYSHNGPAAYSHGNYGHGSFGHSGIVMNIYITKITY